MSYPQKRIDKDWIQKEITDETVQWAKSFGEYLQSDANRTKPLTTSQIRKFFGELKRIQANPTKYREDIPMLKAKLAYAVGRDSTNFRGQITNTTKIREFYDELEMGISFIRPNTDKDLVRFIKVVESIVAYHKFFGGK
ncbi:MAG: type III-A CRISPR-associated protein Csm2 [Sphaerochaetaceae bacterium]|jgi:CRISPR type III-A-associated protein Csm2|nr:type III-A CRISPR-associated protein Csm2 [Sphaerochaetaceae bacterium]